MAPHFEHKAGPPLPWFLVACFVGAILWGESVLVDRHQLTPREAYDALATQPFAQPLPPGIRFDRGGAELTRGDGEVLGHVVFFDLRVEPKAEGGVAVITYEVYASAKTALRLYEDYFADIRDANRSQGRGYRFFQLANQDQLHTCVHQSAQAWCQAVIGSVRIEALSRIPMFDPGQPSRINALFASALDHLDQATKSR
jgi:hypothetical protein